MTACEQVGCPIQVESRWAVQQGEGAPQWQPDYGNAHAWGVGPGISMRVQSMRSRCLGLRPHEVSPLCPSGSLAGLGLDRRASNAHQDLSTQTDHLHLNPPRHSSSSSHSPLAGTGPQADAPTGRLCPSSASRSPSTVAHPKSVSWKLMSSTWTTLEGMSTSTLGILRSRWTIPAL